VRIHFDTNVLVSAFATRGLCADLLYAVLAEHQLIVGEAVLGELVDVLERKIGLPSDVLEQVDAFLRREAELVDAAPQLSIRIRDASDLAILSEAVAGRADYLVTGDRDLLSRGDVAPLPVVTPRGLWEVLRTGDT